MTEMAVEFEIGTIGHLDAEWEICCEIPARAQATGHGTPICKGDPAKWVGWRANCCPQSPRYLLLCDSCKNIYQSWIRQNASIHCGDCGVATGGFVRYTELNKT